MEYISMGGVEAISHTSTAKTPAEHEHWLVNAAIADYLNGVGDGVELKELMQIADTYAVRLYDFRKHACYETEHDMLLFRGALEDKMRQAIATYAARLKQAEDVLRMANKALKSKRSYMDAEFIWHDTWDEELVSPAIAAINQQLGEK